MTISNVGRTTTLFLGLGLFFAAPVQADLYTCKNKSSGETTWRNSPCSGHETLLSKEIQTKPPSERPPAAPSSATSQAPTSRMDAKTAGSGQNDKQIKDIGQQVATTIINDPQLMQKLMALQNTSTFRSILDDPDLLAKIQSGQGLEDLAQDPRIQKLMQHPMVQELKSRTAGPK
ncbi:MAG: hypothetical protein HQL63_09465 [Magnetococcales bacterium]|nr:hypothetical protein [Magnetococcales bacterium]MBF0321371.1 hypothetical protein [Magnetococcales bacterium]